MKPVALLKVAKIWFTRNKTTICAVGGNVMWGIGFAWGIHESVKLHEVLETAKEEHKVERVRDLPFTTVAKETTKHMAGPLAFAVGGTATSLYGHKLSMAAITTAGETIAILQRREESLQEAIHDVVGDKKGKEIISDALQKEVNKDIENGLTEMDIQKVPVNGSACSVSLFKMGMTSQYFRSTLQEVDKAFYRFNKKWGFDMEDVDPHGRIQLNDDEKCLSDLWDELRLDPCYITDQFHYLAKQFAKSNMRHGVTYKTTLIEGPNKEPCYYIQLTDIAPIYRWWENPKYA